LTNRKIILFNPKSGRWKHRVPNSILKVAASVSDQYHVDYVDGNLEDDPWETIKSLLEKGEHRYFGVTVMPGPQLKQAIPISKKVREHFPEIKIIWGGYFATNHCNVVLESGFIDVVVAGPGDTAFPNLLNAWENNLPLDEIKNLIYRDGSNKIIKTKKEELLDQDTLPQMPYTNFNQHYPIQRYLAKTFMGKKTMAYHSSFGCPFTCSFCAVVPIYNARWKGESAEKMYREIKWLKDNYGVDSLEFHDNNFFTSRKRVVEFSKLMLHENMGWWGEGRIDTLDKYSDEDLQLMADAGCKMIFFGAESGSDEVLKQMDKGGTQTAEQIEKFATRLSKFNIVPEYSFVLGLPGKSEAQVMKQINEDIRFIKKLKRLNASTEIIIYLYSPVPTEGSELHDQITKAGFHFPATLEDWLDPSWENFDLRKNPLTPWLTPKMVDRVKNFETVLNGYHPTVSDFRVKGAKRFILRASSLVRYKTGFYKYPYEIKVLHKIWKYRQPEIEGFYSE
jgi:anaerobic magnesium-protoporphyrin IX monomethyl ester cyclase